MATTWFSSSSSDGQKVLGFQLFLFPLRLNGAGKRSSLVPATNACPSPNTASWQTPAAVDLAITNHLFGAIKASIQL
jgi:NADPH:quinone reductase-like Zn-dependent oxidoreductase